MAKSALLKPVLPAASESWLTYTGTATVPPWKAASVVGMLKAGCAAGTTRTSSCSRQSLREHGMGRWVLRAGQRDWRSRARYWWKLMAERPIWAGRDGGAHPRRD